MVVNTETSAYVSSIEWSSEGGQLSEATRKHELPLVSKIIKGQYERIGVPSISCPYTRSVVMWFNGGKVLKMAAQCVKFKESKSCSSSFGASSSRAQLFGPKLAIPDNFDGYFEILSEEGRSVKSIESVLELVKRPPESCLVREPLKVYLSKSEDYNLVSDKSLSLASGEVLTLVNLSDSSPSSPSSSPGASSTSNTESGSPLSESATKTLTTTTTTTSNTTTTTTSGGSSSSGFVGSSCSSSTSSAATCSTNEPSESCSPLERSLSPSHQDDESPSSSPPHPDASSSFRDHLHPHLRKPCVQIVNGRYLKCRTSKGQIVYLPLDSKCRLSPVAKGESISGVHRVCNLLMKRLPLMVRLVSGKAPAGFKSFVPEMRVFSVFEQEYLIAMPLYKECSNLIAVPVTVPLKILAPKNLDLVRNEKVFNILCQRFNNDFKQQQILPNRIQVIENSFLCKEMRKNWREMSIRVTDGGQHEIHSSLTTVQPTKYDHKRRLQGNASPPPPTAKERAEGSDSGRKIKRKSRCKVNTSSQWVDSDERKCSMKEERKACSESITETDNDSFYDEIDQIYDYVRGFAPLPEKLRDGLKCDNNVSSGKPEPPSVDSLLYYNAKVHSSSADKSKHRISDAGLHHHQSHVHLYHHQNLHHQHPVHRRKHLHHSHQQRRLSYPTIVHEIMPKVSLLVEKNQKVTSAAIPRMTKYPSQEHIYEKVTFDPPSSSPDSKRFSKLATTGGGHNSDSNGNSLRIPTRSNSTGKMCMVNGDSVSNGISNGLSIGGHSCNNQASGQHYNDHNMMPPSSNHLCKPKLFVKSGHQTSAVAVNGNGRSKPTKLVKYSSRGNSGSGGVSSASGNSPVNGLSSSPNEAVSKWTYRSSRSLTTSPLFNIRYKSLTNLHWIPGPLMGQGISEHHQQPSMIEATSPFSFKSKNKKGHRHRHDYQANINNNTLESSKGSGGEVSTGSSGQSSGGGNFEDRKAKSTGKSGKLSRPLSFSNLFWDLKSMDSKKCDHLDPRISSLPDYVPLPVSNVMASRRVGTLYL